LTYYLNYNLIQFVPDDHVKKILYVMLNKALYVALQATLMFWKKLTLKLQEWGFTINSYNQCVANQMIKGSQCIIILHVDELRISHVKPKVITSNIGNLSKVFGVEAALTVHLGNVQKSQGMIISFWKKDKIVIRVNPYVKSIQSEAPGGFIRFLVMKDRIEKGEARIVQCNTQNMIVEFFTKPLEGALFTQHCNHIMKLKTNCLLLSLNCQSSTGVC
jgi:hypothetical protein